MPSEIRKGENPAVTNLVGASAAPNHAPAAKPHATPRPCREALDNLVFTASTGCAAISLGKKNQQDDAENQYGDGNPEVAVGQYGGGQRAVGDQTVPGSV